MTTPVLFLASEDDFYAPTRATTRFYQRATAPKSEIHMFTGTEHASDLLHGVNATNTIELISAFIRSVT